MADAHKRKFDVVAVWKFDRFARSVWHLLRALETRIPFARKKCSLRSGGASIQRRTDRLAWGKIGYSLAVNGGGSLYAPSTSAKR